MEKISTTFENFEKLSKSIVQYLFRNTDVAISQTRTRKDGGYDIIVEYEDGLVKQNAFFECKLRKGNLNLRDIAANVIIAFNHGAVAMIAITNHNFTQQTGEELVKFLNQTVLNIKIIAGNEVKQLIEECGEPITQELRKYFEVKSTLRKDEFYALRINLNENILQQIFPLRNDSETTINSSIECFFKQQISDITDHIQKGHLVVVSGYFGVGKHEIIHEALSRSNNQVISLDATLHATKDLVVLELLAQIWGIPTTDLFESFEENDLLDITETIGNAQNTDETKLVLTALLNEKYARKRVTARQNAILGTYIANLMNLHKKNIKYVVHIRKLQFASKEVYDFLVYLIKYLSSSSISGIVSYQEPEYQLQESKNFVAQLKHIDNYMEIPVKPFDSDDAIKYIESIYPEMSYHMAQLIVSKIGTRFYNLTYLLKNVLKQESMQPINSKLLSKKLQYMTPNNVGNQLAYILLRYKTEVSELFEILFLFDCRVSLEVYDLAGIPIEKIDKLCTAKILKGERGIVTAQNEFVYDWIMHEYSANNVCIQQQALHLLPLLESHSSLYHAELISLYSVLGFNEKALGLLNKDIFILKRDKQYTVLRRELVLAVEIAKSQNDYIAEANYLIMLLDTMTIQKELNTDKALNRMLELEKCIKNKNMPNHFSFALIFFKLKRAFKTGKYTNAEDGTIALANQYYLDCLEQRITDNSDDWLGKICACYALLVKETKGNNEALEVFTNALNIFPESFELRREYYSHIACMQLYNNPMSAFSNYQKIITLFDEEAADAAALPFHEYGDLAMSKLIAKDYKHALELVEEAIEIGRSNGLADEEGRCINIRGCIEWCLGDLKAAKHSFIEATSIMCYSGYAHYAWRSQLNLLQMIFNSNKCEFDKVTMLKETYSTFKQLLAGKISFLSRYKATEFRMTREYHALLMFGVLWDQLDDAQIVSPQICADFKLGEHDTLYHKDIETLLSGNYNIMNSPYIQNGYIYFVG